MHNINILRANIEIYSIDKKWKFHDQNTIKMNMYLNTIIIMFACAIQSWNIIIQLKHVVFLVWVLVQFYLKLRFKDIVGSTT